MINDSNINEIDKNQVDFYVNKNYWKSIKDINISFENLLSNIDICKKSVDENFYTTFAWIYFFKNLNW